MEPGQTVPQISFLTLKDIIWAEVRYETELTLKNQNYGPIWELG